MGKEKGGGEEEEREIDCFMAGVLGKGMRGGRDM